MNTNTIDLDELLFGVSKLGSGNASDDAKIIDFWQNGDWCEEKYLVEAIERHLLTEDDRKLMFDKRMSIEQMLNGRTTEESTCDAIYGRWNEKLGFHAFGF